MNTGALNLNNEKRTFKMDFKQYGMAFALVVIFAVFGVLSKGTNLSAMNINNLIMQNSYVVILATGMLLCIITGNVDLSVGSIVAFTGALCAILVLDYKVPVPFAFLITLVVGLITGMWQGFFIANLGVPPFIVTLANMLIFRGLTMLILKGQTKGPLPEQYTAVGAGFLPTIKLSFGSVQIDVLSLLVGVVGTLLLVLSEMNSLNVKKKNNFATPPLWQTIVKLCMVAIGINFITYKLSRYNGLPTVLLILLIIIILYSFVTTRMVVGRQIYAVGGNEKAAKLAGIKTKRVMFWVYANMGLLSALAGIVLSARNASATPKAGDGFELDAIASCYIGGASAYGGTGSLIGAVVGAMIMGILNNGMSIIGWSVDLQKIVKGLVLLGAVTIDLLSKRKKS